MRMRGSWEDQKNAYLGSQGNPWFGPWIQEGLCGRPRVRGCVEAKRSGIFSDVAGRKRSSNAFERTCTSWGGGHQRSGEARLLGFLGSNLGLSVGGSRGSSDVSVEGGLQRDLI